MTPLEKQSTAELHAIATRALANGDDYARRLLREQLEDEEFSERSDLARWGRLSERRRLVRSAFPSEVLREAVSLWTALYRG
jgi:hypothetical protein